MMRGGGKRKEPKEKIRLFPEVYKWSVMKQKCMECDLKISEMCPWGVSRLLDL